MTDTRPCTCAPDERPYPCQHQYALGLCRKAEIRSLRTELDRLIAQITDLTKLRLEDELVHGNVMGRIAVALFGDQNNRTDEECVARAAEIGYELSGAKQRAERAEADLAAARAECEHFKNCISAREVRAMVDERNKAWSNLADARVLLEQCLPHIRGNVGAWEQIRPKLGPDGQRSTDHAIAEGRALLAAIDTALGGK